MLNDAILTENQKRRLCWVALASVLVLLAGLVFDPERAWSNLLVGAFGLLTMGLGGTVFVALTCVSGAGWHVAFRRVPEAMAMIVPVAGAAVLLVLLLRIREYGWHHHGEGDAGTFWFKELWLTPLFWYLRAVGYVAIWSLLGARLVARSREQGRASRETQLSSNVGLSAWFLAVYAVTFSLASVDWIMALEPLWFSTMWGVYGFAGMILSSLAVVVVLGILLSAPGRPLAPIFRQEHLHDLGKLLLGFSCFWMYLWFSQYMLIWYSNIPEETSYFVARTHGSWGPVVVASIVLNWGLPFFVLLPKRAKRSRGVMIKVAAVILVGRWVDLYLMVFPPTVPGGPVFGLWELAALCAVAASGLLLLDRSFSASDPVPKNDPYLTESLHYHAL